MALGDVIARLSVHLGLETAAFEKNVGKAKREVTGMERHISKAGTAIKAAFVGMFGALAVGQLADLAKRGLEYASSLGEVAAQAGVSAKSLQEYRYAASQAGIETGEMDQALSQLSRRLGDAAQGSKSIQAAFDKLGVSVRDANGNVRDAGDVIPLIADGLQKIESPAERAAILVDLFGKSGQKLAPLLEGGAAGVNNLRDAAHKLGIVLSDDVIQNADDAADKLSAMKQVLEAKIAGFAGQNAKLITDLADKLLRLAEAALKAANAVAKFVDQSGPGRGEALSENIRIQRANQGNVGTGTDIGIAVVRPSVGGRGIWLPGQPGDARVNGKFTRGFRPGYPKGGRGGGGGANAIGSSPFGGLDWSRFTPGQGAGFIKMAQAANDMVAPTREVSVLIDRMASESSPRLLETLKKMSPELAALRSEAQSILDRLFPDQAELRRYQEELSILTQAMKKGQLSTEDYAKAIEALRREFNGFADLIANNQEIVALGVGTTLDDALDAANASWDRFTDRLAEQAQGSKVQIVQTFNDLAQDVLSSINQLSGAIRGGGFLDILTAVVGLGIQLGSVGVFGKKVADSINKPQPRARGGPISAGRPYLVGEKGPELVVPAHSGRVIPNGALGSGGSLVEIRPTPYFEAVVDGRIVRAAPTIMDGSAKVTTSRLGRQSSRRLYG